MKLSIEQANKLLKKLGADAVVVEDEAQVTPDIDIDEVSTSIEEGIATSITPALEAKANESATSIQAAKFGRMEAKNIANVFGINPKELEGLPHAKMLEKAKAIVSKSPEENNEEATRRIAEMEEDYKTKLEEATTERDTYKDKYIGGHVNSKLQSVIETIPRKGGKIDAQVASFKGYLQSRVGNIQYDENADAIAFTKDGKPVFKGNKPYDLSELAKQWADDNGISVTDTRHVPPPSQPGGIPVKTGGQSIAEFLDNYQPAV